MSRHRKDRGLRTERVVVEYLSQWWGGLAVGRGAGKDVVNFPIDLEIKARADFNPLEYLRQSKKRGAISGEPSFVVCRMNGQGEIPESYLAFTDLQTLVQILLKAGYADMPVKSVQLEPSYCHCGNTVMKGSKCPICEKLDNANL
jgi:hypothetical protein